jgi:hypothetical protein
LEGGGWNVRVWGNYIDRTMVKIAIAGLSVGPIYLFRNVAGVSRFGHTSWSGEPFLKMGGAPLTGGGRAYVFHNTILQPAGPPEARGTVGCAEGLNQAGGPELLSVVSRNNILHVRHKDGHSIRQWSKEPQPSRAVQPSGAQARPCRSSPSSRRGRCCRRPDRPRRTVDSPVCGTSGVHGGRCFMERRAFLQAAVALPMAAAANSRAWGAEDGIRLIVRADDIGSSHAANVACIKCYRQGVARSVEVMVPCPWFNEAVEMLNANPAYDVGVHRTLTSEWTNLKWRPMTHCPSLVDDQDNFYAIVWPNPNIGPACSIREANPKIEEIERELRAQIELAVHKIKSVTHLSAHMGFTSASPELAAVVDKLSQEYRLPARIDGARGVRMERANTSDQKIAAFVKMLLNVTARLRLADDDHAAKGVVRINRELSYGSAWPLSCRAGWLGATHVMTPNGA